MKFVIKTQGHGFSNWNSLVIIANSTANHKYETKTTMYSSFNRKRKIFYECSSSDSESTGDEPTFYKSIGQLKVTKVNPTETRVVNKEKKQRRMETSDKKEVTNEEGKCFVFST